MDTSDYKKVLLEQVRGRARAEALLTSDVGDPITPGWVPDRAAIVAYFREAVDGQVARYERGSSEPYALALDLADAYAQTFRDVLFEVGKRVPLKPPVDIPHYLGIVNERYIKVEYDLSYFGGDYEQAGHTAKVTSRLINFYKGSVPVAFEATTGHDPCHIISWQEEEYIDDAAGEEHLADEQEKE